jgi:HlyD family secretion protein
VVVANGSKQSTVRVTIGLAGANLTQIKSGLQAGQKVVVADLSQPLPGSASTTTTTTGRPGGGAAGGAARPGG